MTSKKSYNRKHFKKRKGSHSVHSSNAVNNIESEEKVETKNLTVVDKIKSNYWILSTLVLAVVLAVSFFSTVPAISSGSFDVVDSKVAGESFVEVLNSFGQAKVEYVSSGDYSDYLYVVNISTQGRTLPVYVTKDGKYATTSLMPLGDEELEKIKESAEAAEENKPATPEVEKSDKPVVELFIMSHCPYGTQAVKGIIPAIEALGDNIDFTLRFVYYAMHPTAGEVEEQLNQYCIQKEQKDKLLPYLKCFLDKGESEVCFTEAGVDTDMLSTCYSESDAEFNILANLEDRDNWLSGRFPKFDIDKELNEKYGVKGSPSLIVNGVSVQSGRSPSAYLGTICSSFNEAPEECSTELPTESYTPGFGYDVGAGSDAQCG